jgi:hypothetical protein
MVVDRNRFLKLAVAIAASSQTLACSSSSDDSVSASAEAEMQSVSAGGTCSARSIAKPGEGSVLPYSYQEGYCFDLARWEGEPDASGSKARWSDFVYDHCQAYSTQLQPAVAKQVKDCLDRAERARRHDARSHATSELDAGAMYTCGKVALWSICKDGIDDRVNAAKDATGKGRCDRVADALARRGDKRPLSSIQTECAAVLSGLKVPARSQIEYCVTSDGWNLYTCVEGLEP